MLIKHLLEFCDLLLVGLEADHFEDAIKSCKVDSELVVPVAFVTRTRLQIEYLFEVFTVHVANAWLVVRIVRTVGNHFKITTFSFFIILKFS